MAQAQAPRPKPTPPKRIVPLARLKWVKVGDMRVSTEVQRDLNEDRVGYLLANYDDDKVGHPYLSYRGGDYWIIDGQHRCAATHLKHGEQTEIQCWVYEGLTEKDEAEMFLRLNDVLSVSAYDKFDISVQAERPLETEVNRIVRDHGLTVGRYKTQGQIQAVGTLRRTYEQQGTAVLDRTLEIIGEAFGDPGLTAMMIAGMGLFLGRHGTDVDLERLTSRLAGQRGGVNGVLGKAEILRRQVNRPKRDCVASVITDVYNAGRGGKKLPAWFK